jgi:hypothetical protein
VRERPGLAATAEGRRSRAPGERMGGRAPPPGEERGGEGVRGAARGEENMKNHVTTKEVSHRVRRPSLEPRRKPSIDRDSEVPPMNRTHCDKALDETNASVLSKSHARIWSNCSLELEPSRTSASNSESCELNRRKSFRALERARREEARHIYIYSWGPNEI